MADEREYLTEWPIVRDDKFSPKRRRIGEPQGSSFNGVPSVHGRKYEECIGLEETSSGCDGRCCASFWPATVALARWWRKCCQRFIDLDVYQFPDSENPNTILKYMASLPDGKEFLEQQVQQLQKQVLLHPWCCRLHAILGSFYDKLRHLDKAFHHLSMAVNLDPKDKETQWLLIKVKRDKALQERMKSLRESFSEDTQVSLTSPVQVERRHCSTLNVQEFFTKYCCTSTPVIITGIVQHMTTETWTLEHVKEVIGHKTAPLRKTVKESPEWARLEPAEQTTVSEFIDTLHSQSKPRYLFDWSLPTFAPELAAELTIPKYFAGDFLQHTRPGSLYRDSWPSLFIAPAGLHSDLHVDAFGSNFWMALFQGRKRWTFFSNEDLPLLYPHYEHSLDVVFDVDLSSPDLKRFPLLSQASPRQCILQPGELLFVPHGSPHRVENLDTSLAISANFIDLSNFQDVLSELRCNALVDPRAENLLEQLSATDFPDKMYSQQEDLAWDEFKQWPREDYSKYDIHSKPDEVSGAQGSTPIL